MAQRPTPGRPATHVFRMSEYTMPNVTFRFPLGISRVRGEEDHIGHAEIDRDKFSRAITNTLTDFGHRADRRSFEAVSAKLADHYEPQLPGALYSWLSRFVEFEFRVSPMTDVQFLEFIKTVRWDAAILGV